MTRQQYEQAKELGRQAARAGKKATESPFRNSRRFPYLRALWPGILVVVRNPEEERRYRRDDMIGVGVFLAALIACGAWLGILWWRA